MEMKVYDNKASTSQIAAQKAAKILKNTIEKKGKAVFVAATGASQFDFLKALVKDDSIDWRKTEMFHLDEYIGLSETHSASFRKYLMEWLVSKVGDIGEIHFIRGDSEDPQKECQRLNSLLYNKTIDISFVGVGENGHLAFNDPPANFNIKDPYIIADLDIKCRQQQVNEGWFKTIDQVPRRAITMSVKQIMKSESIICTLPGNRKAQAVKECFQDSYITPEYPASILKEHDKAYIYLDKESASLINLKK